MERVQLKTQSLKGLNKRIQKKVWKLVSIYETGLVPDVAKYNDDVEVVFGKLNIYATYGKRSEVFPYQFVSEKIFKVKIGDDIVLCRIHTLQDNKLIFHADYNDSHFILELHSK